MRTEEGDISATVLVVVIGKPSLVRDCLIRCLQWRSRWSVAPFDDVQEWLAADAVRPALVVLAASDSAAAQELAQVAALSAAGDDHRAPVLVLSDIADPDHVIAVLGRGARGVLPSDASLEIAVEAMRFVLAGGVFVPASSLVAARRQPSAPANPSSAAMAASEFTARQLAVIKALRQGKANNIIAYELNMCESTVKVYVRNIMKKLKARNRTQVAFLAGKMIDAMEK